MRIATAEGFPLNAGPSPINVRFSELYIGGKLIQRQSTATLDADGRSFGWGYIWVEGNKIRFNLQHKHRNPDEERPIGTLDYLLSGPLTMTSTLTPFSSLNIGLATDNKFDLYDLGFNHAQGRITTLTTEPGECLAQQPTLDIRSVGSAQYKNFDCNRINRDGEMSHTHRDNWKRNKPLLFGTRANGRGYVSVELSASGETARAQGLTIGIRTASSKMTVALQEPDIGSSSTEVSFPVSSLQGLYEVFLGRRTGGASTYDTVDVFPIALNPVESFDYNKSVVFLSGLSLGSAKLSPFTLSPIFLELFLSPGSEVDGFAKPTTGRIETSDWRLTHPTGQPDFSKTCSADILLYTAERGSAIEDGLLGSEQLAYVIRKTLQANKAALDEALKQNGVPDRPFQFHEIISGDGGGENQWGPFIPSLNVLTETDMFYAVNQLEVSGSISVELDTNTRAVRSLKVTGFADDLIDFDITQGAFSRWGATVQAGYSTVGNSGRPYLVRINISIDTAEFDFFPNNPFKAELRFP
ncbi:MAG TPA: hypothetical protein VM120_25945 [Bryobacteraceae bacterium]|nr:hypothetical protein [Bryobacteraceae bacterium]